MVVMSIFPLILQDLLRRPHGDEALHPPPQLIVPRHQDGVPHRSDNGDHFAPHRHRPETLKKTPKQKTSLKTWKRDGGDDTPLPPTRARTRREETPINAGNRKNPLVYHHGVELEVALGQEPDLLYVLAVLTDGDPLVLGVDVHHRYLVAVHPVDEAYVLHLRGLQGVPQELVRVLEVLEDLDLLIRHHAEPLDLLSAAADGEADLPLLDGEDDCLFI